MTAIAKRQFTNYVQIFVTPREIYSYIIEGRGAEQERTVSHPSLSPLYFFVHIFIVGVVSTLGHEKYISDPSLCR